MSAPGEGEHTFQNQKPRPGAGHDKARQAAKFLLNDSVHQSSPQAGATRAMAWSLLNSRRVGGVRPTAAGIGKFPTDLERGKAKVEKLRNEVMKGSALIGEPMTFDSLPSDPATLRTMAAALRCRCRDAKASLAKAA